MGGRLAPGLAIAQNLRHHAIIFRPIMRPDDDTDDAQLADGRGYYYVGTLIRNL